jgi:N-acetylmuramoyl-L-alanine amidase
MQCGDGRQLPGSALRPHGHDSLYARFVAFLIAFCVLAAPPPAAAEGTVRDIRVTHQSDGVRVIVDLSLQAAYSYQTLDGPPRLAIDLPEVAWLVPSSRGERPVGFVKGFRFGRFKPGVSRLVLDLGRPFQVTRVYEMAPTDTSGFRIVAELRALPEGAAVRPARVVSRPQAPPPPAPKGKPQAAPQQVAAVAAGQPVPRLKPSLAPLQHVVVLDPGHGGIDPGALGHDGTLEKDVVMAVARALRKELEATGHYKVVLTRDGDRFVRLRDRLQIARQSGGELFLSIHADSLTRDPKVAGAAVYTLSERASSEEAARLAAAENRADILGGIDLSHQEAVVTQILIDLAQRDANNKSIHVAELLLEQLNDATRMVRKDRQQAGFVVLKSPDMPSVLLELGYLSNPEDERRLTNPAHIAKLSQAIVRAIDRFFQVQQF